MYIKIDDLEIKNKHLTGLIVDVDKRILFQGRALEHEGKKICERLSKFKEGQIVEVEMSGNSYSPYEGICEIVRIEFPAPTVDKAPAIFRFNGILKPVI